MLRKSSELQSLFCHSDFFLYLCVKFCIIIIWCKDNKSISGALVYQYFGAQLLKDY
jgi:hypothetical protein